jgi:MFS family permease
VLLVGLGLLLRDRPGPGQAEGARAADVAPAGEPAPVAAIVRSPQFWSIGISVAAAFAIMQAIAVTLAPLGLANGLSTVQAATLMSAMGGGAILATLLLAVVADRIDRIVLMTAILALGAFVQVGLATAASYGVLLGMAALLGITSGALSPLFLALIADRFGPASFGTVRGLTMPLIGALGMVAVRFAGEVFDRTGGYAGVFHVFLVVQLAAAAVMFATRFTAPVRPAAAAAARGP